MAIHPTQQRLRDQSIEPTLEIIASYLKEAIDAVKVLYGQDVDYKLTYCFTPTGIGDNITIIIKVGEQKFEKDNLKYLKESILNSHSVHIYSIILCFEN